MEESFLQTPGSFLNLLEPFKVRRAGEEALNGCLPLGDPAGGLQFLARHGGQQELVEGAELDERIILNSCHKWSVGGSCSSRR